MPTTVRPSASNPFPPNARRQRHFLRRIEAQLIAQPWLAALWLGGSPARGEADQWSSVDLHLLLRPDAEISLTETRLNSLLEDVFAEGWTELPAPPASLEGFTHSPGVNRGGVYFRLLWTTADDLTGHRARHGPLRLCWAAADLTDDLAGQLSAIGRGLPEVDPQAVQRGLFAFWQPLAHLPAAIRRGEELAAAALLHKARQQLIELVVALNGATRPPSPSRINRFLGPAQQEAFEKSLGQSRGAEGWIGQGVALIVLYRWYAPQLVEIYGLHPADRLEESILGLLSAELSDWPARITTE